jgi:hypothetical protein
MAIHMHGMVDSVTGNRLGGCVWSSGRASLGLGRFLRGLERRATGLDLLARVHRALPPDKVSDQTEERG